MKGIYLWRGLLLLCAAMAQKPGILKSKSMLFRGLRISQQAKRDHVIPIYMSKKIDFFFAVTVRTTQRFGQTAKMILPAVGWRKRNWSRNIIEKVLYQAQ